MIPFGVRIIENSKLVDFQEDWSLVRSPSRAIRRLRRGYRQNIRVISTPKRVAFSIDNGQTLIMHPVLAAELRKATS